MDEKLLPCPFCNNPDVQVRFVDEVQIYVIDCPGCLALASFRGVGESKIDTIKMWNRDAVKVWGSEIEL